MNDAEPALVLEAARAISDVPIEEARPALARLNAHANLLDPLALRVLNACFRGGTLEDAHALARFAADESRSEVTRIEALEMLAEWPQPSGRDRVMGLWRPLATRPAENAVLALSPLVATILESGPENVVRAAALGCNQLKVVAARAALVDVFRKPTLGSTTRCEALKALATIGDANLESMVKEAVADQDATFRSEGRRWLAKLKPVDAVPLLVAVMQEGDVSEKQSAIQTLGELDCDAADQVLASWLTKLSAGEVPPEIQLDLITVCEQRTANGQLIEQLAVYNAARPRDDALAAYRECLSGGSAQRGRTLFFEKTEVACLRCHRVGTRGGEVGPVLNSIGLRENREYLLEAIVSPDRKIAKDFESVVLALDSGEVLTGVFKGEDDREVRLMTPEGQLLKIEKARIEERSRGPSAMPDQASKLLSKAEIRDLVEFLSSLH